MRLEPFALEQIGDVLDGIPVRADLALVGSATSRGVSLGSSTSGGDRLAAEPDVTLRVCGIATRRHGAAWSGSRCPWSARAAGRTIDDGGTLTPPTDSFDVIQRLGSSARRSAIVVETTTLDITRGAAGDRSRARGDRGRLPRRHGQQGAGGVRVRGRSATAAAAAGVSFLFEGAVMDGVPIFNLVRETLPVVEVLGFRGVVNSTTNHILSALEDGDAFAPALARMQARGHRRGRSVARRGRMGRARRRRRRSRTC